MKDGYEDYRKELKEAFKNNEGAASVTVLTDKDYNSVKSADIAKRKFGGNEPWTIEQKKNGRFWIIQRHKSSKATWQMTNVEYLSFKAQNELSKTDLSNRMFNISQAINAGLPVPKSVKTEYGF